MTTLWLSQFITSNFSLILRIQKCLDMSLKIRWPLDLILFLLIILEKNGSYQSNSEFLQVSHNVTMLNKLYTNTSQYHPQI